MERSRPELEKLLVAAGFTLLTSRQTGEERRDIQVSNVELVSFERGFAVVTYHVTIGSIIVPVVMLNVAFKAKR